MTLPDRETLLRFLSETPAPVSPGEILRAFGLGPPHKAALRDMLRTLAAEGALGPTSRPRGVSGLAQTVEVVITGIGRDGRPTARPVTWRSEERAPIIFMHPEQKGRPALVIGTRVMARLRLIRPGRYEGRSVSRPAEVRVAGVFRAASGHVLSCEMRTQRVWTVAEGITPDDGDIVVAEPLPHDGKGDPAARILSIEGHKDAPGAESLMSLLAHNLPVSFPEDVLAEAALCRPVVAAEALAAGREDLRDLPFVTLDGADARDFDDAIWAEAVPDGHRVIVAIADVAHYVRQGSALDREARLRGHSVYFPDRTVPMLPDHLSGDLCSLRAGQDRPCVFVSFHIDAAGQRREDRLARGLIRVRNRLTYEQAQAMRDGESPDILPAGLLDALYSVARVLSVAAAQRGAFALEQPEWRVRFDAAGHPGGMNRAERLDAHRVVEQLMVQANAAAAEALQRSNRLALYRLHPGPEHPRALRTLLAEAQAACGGTLSPDFPELPSVADLARFMSESASQAESLSRIMLKAHGEARYGTNPGMHFGLGLESYAHFTSPIRRYADLLLHRALLGEDGIPEERRALDALAAHLAFTERRAAQAGREAVERCAIACLRREDGAVMTGHVSGATRAGILVTLTETGTIGLVSNSSLPPELLAHGSMRERNAHYGRVLRVRLENACTMTGTLFLALADIPS